MTVQTTAPDLPAQALQLAAPVRATLAHLAVVTELGRQGRRGHRTPLCRTPGGPAGWREAVDRPDRNPRVRADRRRRGSFRRGRQVAISTGAVVSRAPRSLGLRTLAAATTGVYVVGGKADPVRRGHARPAPLGWLALARHRPVGYARRHGHVAA